MEYHIYHMFPKLLNLYGDRGNIASLAFFAKEVGLTPIIHEINDVSEIDWKNIDFMLIGGGSDREQAIVTKYLLPLKTQLKEAIENGLPLLAVCGGYQFLGNYYQDAHAHKIECLQILDFYTIAQEKERLIDNTVIQSSLFNDIVGFVNHGGETFHNYQTLGQVKCGYGNNLQSKEEGLVYKNLIATYLHGPLLPKNVALTLFFLQKHFEKINKPFIIDHLDLSLEQQAQAILIERYLNKR
ncbi:MAG: type 1 glutamine amidotransferase [Bacilli bacterium]